MRRLCYSGVLYFMVFATSFIAATSALAAIVKDSDPSWQVLHEDAEDKTKTSTAYVENAKGDRFSLTINAVQKKKVCALLPSSPPTVMAKDYQGKVLVDGQVIWQGKMHKVADPLADIFFLDWGFDWTVQIEGLRKGKELVVEYGSGSGEPARLKFKLAGSTKAIDSVMELQGKLVEESSAAPAQKKTP